MPVTSYMLKTSLFFILKGTSDIRRISEALRYTFETSGKLKDAERDKLQYKPNPRWATERDLQEHAEDARIVASRIFRFIDFLAKNGCKLISYWKEPGITSLEVRKGELAYIADICESALGRLDKDIFFQQ